MLRRSFQAIPQARRDCDRFLPPAGVKMRGLRCAAQTAHFLVKLGEFAHFAVGRFEFSQRPQAASGKKQRVARQALPRHIRAGDDQQPVFAAIQARVVRNERLVKLHLLDDRMAAFCNLNPLAVVHLRLDVEIALRDLRQRRQCVQDGDGLGRAQDALDFAADGLPKLLKQGVFEFNHAVFRA